jgi:hypothetical protein
MFFAWHSLVWLVLGVAELGVLLLFLFWSVSLPESVVGRSDCLSANGLSDLCYCEAFTDGVFKEYYNTISALAFSTCGLLISLFLSVSSEPSPINRMRSDVSFPAMYAALSIFLGPGSMMFHANLSGLGGFFDTFSMFNWL